MQKNTGNTLPVFFLHKLSVSLLYKILSAIYNDNS